MYDACFIIEYFRTKRKFFCNGVTVWVKEEAGTETLEYKSQAEDAVLTIPFHLNKHMDYNRQNFLMADISFTSRFIMALRWTLYAGKLEAVISLSRI